MNKTDNQHMKINQRIENLLNKAKELVDLIHMIEPYKQNQKHHRFFVIDLHDYGWFFLFDGEQTIPKPLLK